RRVEQTEQGKARKIDAARLNSELVADQVDLRVEHPVLVDDSFRRPGAAAGEDDRGWIGRLGLDRFKRLPWGASEAAIGRPAPEPARPDGEVESRMSKPAAIGDPHCMHERNGEK